MQGYSINGFLNTVLRRTGKTLLVEGVSDRQLVMRLCIASNKSSQSKIDCVDIINDSQLSTLGNKSKALELAEAASRSSKSGQILDKLSILIDREWDGVDINLVTVSGVWAKPINSHPVYFTCGHSSENYSFHLEFIDSYLKLCFPDIFNSEFYRELSSRFKKIVNFSYAYSILIRDKSLLSRSNGLLSRTHLSWASAFSLNSSFIKDAFVRSSVVSPQELSDINLLANANSAVCLEDVHRWLSHGHVGEEAIWVCVASLASEYISDDKILDEIERGNRKFKHLFAGDFISNKLTIEQRDPLDTIVKWLE